MSKSVRTQQPAAHAARKQRLGEGPLRIVIRRARAGDVHPIDAGHLRNLLRAAPLPYVQGLRRVELRARPNERIGQPFGLYRPREKTVILYSLPLTWSWGGATSEPSIAASMRWAGAAVTSDASGVTIRWPSRERMGFWFWIFVVNHELGHHFRVKYRGRRSLSALNHEEVLADVHARRVFAAFVRRGRARRRGAGGLTRG